MDLSLADYNGGPKAIKAFAKGKPFDESAGYSPSSTARNMSRWTRSSPREPPPTFPKAPPHHSLTLKNTNVMPSMGGVLNNLRKPPAAVAHDFNVDNSVFNFWNEQGIPQVDPEFRWDEKNTEEGLAGIPERHQDYIM